MTVNIPYTVPAPPAPHAGLLYSPDIWNWLAYAVVLAPAAWCMPTGLKDSLRSLWAPVGRWIAALCCPWLWEGCFLWTAVPGAFLEAFWAFWWASEPQDEGEEQLVLKGFPGYLVPIVR